MSSKLKVIPAASEISVQSQQDQVRLQKWLGSLRETTRKRYYTILSRYFAKFPSISDDNVELYMGLQGAVSVNTYRQTVSVLKTCGSRLGTPLSADVLSSLLKDALRERDSLGSLIKPTKKDALQVSQIRAMLKLDDPTGDAQISIRNRTMIALTWAGGFRIDEVLSLRWGHITITENKMYVRLYKWKTQRLDESYHETIITAPTIIQMVQRLSTTVPRNGHAVGKQHPVFYDYRSISPNQLSYDLARLVIHDYAKRIGYVGNVGTHSLRIGYVNDAIDTGVSRDDIGRVTRQSEQTVSRYERNHESRRTSHVDDLL